MKTVLSLVAFLLLIIALLIPVRIHAAGGDTLKYSTQVEALTNGDAFYADIHWHSALDSIASIVNGRMGNVNIVGNANVALTKLDSAGTSKANKFKGDSLRLSAYGAIDSLKVRAVSGIKVDTIYSVNGIASDKAISGTTLNYSSAINFTGTGSSWVFKGIQQPNHAKIYTADAEYFLPLETDVGVILADSVRVAGYTTLGASAPAIMMKKITAFTAATAPKDSSFAHGITTYTKILGVTMLMESGESAALIPPSDTTGGGAYYYGYRVSTSSITLKTIGTSSVNKTVRILITYER